MAETKTQARLAAEMVIGQFWLSQVQRIASAAGPVGVRLREALDMIEEFDTNGMTALTPKGREDVERLLALLGSTEPPP